MAKISYCSKCRATILTAVEVCPQCGTKTTQSDAPDNVVEAAKKKAAMTTPVPTTSEPAAPDKPTQPDTHKTDDASSPSLLKKVGSGLGHKSIGGLPVWTIIILAIVAILVFKGLAGKIKNLSIETTPTVESQLNIVPDEKELLIVGNVTLPIKTSPFPRFPFSEAKTNFWIVSALAFAGCAIAVIDNLQERPNQLPATACNFGMFLTFVGMFLPGWGSFVVGATGVTMLRRARKGSVLRIWPFIIAASFLLYLWFDIVAPNSVEIVAAIRAFAPWLADLLLVLLSADTLRPMVLAWFIMYYILMMFRSDNDQTPMIAMGIFFLGWYSAFGVFPYAENAVVQLVPWILWTLVGLLGIGALLELAETGLLSVMGVVGGIIGITVFASWGIKELLHPANWIMYVSSPLGLSLIGVVIASRAVFNGLTSNEEIKKLTVLLTTWTGSLVVLRKLRAAIPVDVLMTILLGWAIAIIAGVNPWGFTP